MAVGRTLEATRGLTVLDSMGRTATTPSLAFGSGGLAGTGRMVRTVDGWRGSGRAGICGPLRTGSGRRGSGRVPEPDARRGSGSWCSRP
jgi:hypothetical protein